VWSGIVESIYIASEAVEPVKSIPAALAIAGVGLEGDRYALKKGTFSKPEPDRELTLIEPRRLRLCSASTE